MITQTCPLRLFSCIASRWRGSTFRAGRPRCHRIVRRRWPQHRRPRLDETLRSRRGHRVGANTRSRKEAAILEHWTKQRRRIVSISPYKRAPIAPATAHLNLRLFVLNNFVFLIRQGLQAMAGSISVGHLSNDRIPLSVSVTSPNAAVASTKTYTTQPPIPTETSADSKKQTCTTIAINRT